ncbi:MAG: RNA polymerase subunit sigma-54 [Rhodobacteraceae bacterium]|nr:RNA polymerase subunit sigma-54 [Paracoccaceae bacterium]
MFMWVIRTKLQAIPDVWKGMIFMTLSGLGFVSMHSIVKTLGPTLPAFEIAFFRAFFGLLLVVPMVVMTTGNPLKTQKFGLHAMRGFINGISMLLFFLGVTLTPLAELTALSFTAPIFATLLAMLFLGEMVGARRWAAIFVGFAGTIVILRPGFEDVGLGPILIVSSALFWGASMIFVKRLTDTESNLTIVAYASVWLTLACAIPAYFDWIWPNLTQILFLVAAAMMGTLGQFAMNRALKLADASVVLPMDFTRLIWASIIGYFLFSELPDIFTIIGAFMIFGSTTYIGIREQRLRSIKIK